MTIRAFALVAVSCLAPGICLAQVPPVAMSSPPSVSLAGISIPPVTPAGAMAPPSAPAPDEPPVATTQRWVQWARLSGDWASMRSSLASAGIRLSAGQMSDLSAVGRPGADRRAFGWGLLDLNAAFDLDKMGGPKGGSAFVQYFVKAGGHGSRWLGDLQGFSNLDGDSFHHLYEAWYQQVLFRDRLRLKVGRVDANTEFARVASAGEFIAPAAGLSPAIRTLPTYPNPALSVNAFFTPTPNVFLGAGVYDGSDPGDPASRAWATTFLIGESGATWKASGSSLPGRVAVGFWRHNGRFDDQQDTGPSGDSGVYLVIEQAVWAAGKATDEGRPQVTLFAQYSRANTRVEAIRDHLGFGVGWTGPFASRSDDALGVYATWVSVPRSQGGLIQSEYSIGPFYKCQVTPWLSVKPDVRYIRRPGAVEGRGSALAATLRLRVDF